MAYDPGAGRKILYNRRVCRKFWYLTTWIGLALAGVGCAVQPLTPTPISAVARPEQTDGTPRSAGEATATVASPAVSAVNAVTATITSPLSSSTATAELPTPTSVLVLGGNASTAAPPVIVAGDDLAGVFAESLPTETAVPPVVVAPPSADVAAAEQYCIDWINSERAAAGVAPLARDEVLMGIARARVADMIERGYTGHNDPTTGEALGLAMMQAAGYASSFVGENWYGSIKGPPTIVDVAMTWFMTDPPHYQNILSPNYVGVGIGIGFNGQQWLLVQNFAGQ